jgi:hypothetical protein
MIDFLMMIISISVEIGQSEPIHRPTDEACGIPVYRCCSK